MSVEPYTESWLKGPLSTMFYTRLYEPPISTPLRAALVFAHGYLEHIGRYTEVHAKWAQRGIAVFAYDERGFGRTALDEKHKSPDSVYGRTGGAQERMGDIEWAVKHTRSLFDKDVPLFLMGHSMASTSAHFIDDYLYLRRCIVRLVVWCLALPRVPRHLLPRTLLLCFLV